MSKSQKDYLNLARCKKCIAKKIRRAIKLQLQYIRRDRAYITDFLGGGAELTAKQTARLKVIEEVCKQQLYMYENKVHSVQGRIVSISQPYTDQSLGGKVVASVEFGAKLDLSIAKTGLACLERISFDAYNESDVLIRAIERYKERTEDYPERALADKMYRNRDNLAYYKLHGIRLSGPSSGRPKKNATADRKTECTDNADCVEVERTLSLAKRCYGLGLIKT